MARPALFWLLFLIIALFCGITPLPAETVSGSTIEERLDRLESDFIEFRTQMSRKIELILDAVTKDGYLADLIQGPRGEKGEPGLQGRQGPRGESGPPGPSYNDRAVLGRLEKLEEFVTDAEHRLSSIEGETNDVVARTSEVVNRTENEVEAVSRSNFAFSTALQSNLPTQENQVFSPLSLGLILLGTRFGARGQTATQIETALRLPTTDDLNDLVPTRRGFFQALKAIKTSAENYDVTVANGIYAPTGFNVNSTFLKVAKRTLDVSLTQLNYTDESGAAESIISWARNTTNGKAKELFSADSLNSETKLVLVSIVHFKSPWKYPFEVESTQRTRFFWSSRHFQVDMMVSENDFAHGELPELNAKIVSIPYKGDRFIMQVIIPEGSSTLRRIRRGLQSMDMDTIRKNIRMPGACEKVRLHFPKFKIQSSFSLFDPLQKMGVTDMFSETEADFSGIPRNYSSRTPPKLFMSDVIQGAYIAVDEEGSEAAAPAGPRPEVTCAPNVTKIRVDRPFYFQIVENETNVVVLAGNVWDPNA